ncbi:MAG: hypothetical protein AUJ07_11905 [Crenarchaeota archaeon 13_1_40CM_3_53_5]|nr:MAG: hypothetical protein AUJ07_11905 [Crenarchaeota archaeon 13_1_40CM_3_53_5]
MLVIVAVSLLVHVPNLLNYPAWFFDEGAYLTFSAQWVQTGQLSYYGHPFGALTILAILFAAVNPGNYLYPRLLMVALSALDGVLLYKVTDMMYQRSGGFALVAALLYVATPLSARYLRLVVVDNFMALFLLMSLLVLLKKRENNLVSALLFGGAIVSKQTALFFIPAFLVYFRREKRTLARTLLWFVLAAVIPVLWAVYGVSQIGLTAFLDSQFALTGLGGERAVNGLTLILQRITSRDPFIFVGIAGALWASYKRDPLVVFPLTYLLSFAVLFLKISTVYLIPVLPFFSILATLLLFDAFDLTPRLRALVKFRGYVLTVLIAALIISSLLLVTLQNPATPQQQAINYVVDQHPQGVILSYTYLWLFRQNHPEISVYDRYSVPWKQLQNQTVYLVVDYPGDIVTINSIPQYHALYYSNATQQSTKTFTDTASGYTVQVLQGTVT